MWHDEFSNVKRLYSTVWHVFTQLCDTSLLNCVTRLYSTVLHDFTQLRDTGAYSTVWHGCICVTSLIFTNTCLHLAQSRAESCHIWMSHVTHMNATCHTYECVMPWIWMSHATHTRMSQVTHTWMTHPYVAHVTSRVWMGHVTLTNESCHTLEPNMGWLRSVGSIKL